MPKRGRKKRKTTPRKTWSNATSKDASMEENADFEFYTAVEVEEVGDVDDGEIGEANENVDVEYGKEDDVGHGEIDDDVGRGEIDRDDDVLRIDTSWIKEEPVEEELYIHSQEEHNGDDRGRKRKHDEEDEQDSSSKYIKAESDDDYATVDSQELINDNVKTEEDEENLTDDYWEEEEEDVAPEQNVPSPIPSPAVTFPIRLNMQKCAKCAIMFSRGTSINLPSALQNLCRKCKPNVSITCKFCGKHFEHHKLYKRHVRDCSNNRFECRNCKDRFPTQKKFSNHKCIEEPNVLQMLRYVCPICSEGFDKAKYRNHHKGLHVTNKSIKCKCCKMVFLDLPSFQEHMDVHHTVQRIFICTTCNMTIDSLARFYAHKQMHVQEQGKGRHEIQRPPDFVYVCKSCKCWFLNVVTFHEHSCVKKRATQFVANFLEVANDVPKMLGGLGGVVPKLLDFGIPNPLGVPCEAPRTRKKQPQVPALVEPAKTLVYYNARNSLPQTPEAVSAPVEETPTVMALDSAYTCQICKVSFKTCNALGYHSCLTDHKGFDDEDEEEEEEDDDDQGGSKDDQGVSKDDQGVDKNVLSQGESDIRIKLTKSLKPLNYSDVARQAQPKQDSTIPPVPKTNKEESSFNFKHTHFCMVCNNVVKHNFEHVFRRASARYLCPGCMQKVAKQKNYVFKCSKCGQKFPTWDRLNMHLPWHKESTGEEGVFKEPRLACKKLPKRDEMSTESRSLSPAQQNTPDVNSSEGASVGQNNAASGKEEASVAPEQNDILATRVNQSLTDLLKEPVVPISSSLKAGPEEVRIKLREKLASKNRNIPVAPNLGTANSIGQNQLVINAPLIGSNNMSNFRLISQGDSLMSQVSQGMFPPVVDNSKHPAINSQNPSTAPASTVKEIKGTLLKISKDGTISSDAVQKDPKFKEYKGMLLKITNEGAKQTIQVLPQQSTPNLNPPQTQAITTAAVSLPSGQSATPVSMPVESFAGVTAPMTASNYTTVPLSIGGNTLSQKNIDSNSSTLTSTNNNAVGPGTQLPLLRADRIEAAAASSNPVSVISFRQPNNSIAKSATVTIQKTQMAGAPPAPVVASLPVDPSQPPNTPSPRGVFLCYSCNHLFMDIASLKAHGCKIQAFSCHLCNHVLQTAEQLYTHKCTTWSFTCHMCNRKCQSAEELNQHPCIDTNDIRIDHPVNKAPVGGGAFNVGTSKGAGQGANTREAEKSYRIMSWTDISKVKDFTCPACSATFNTKASLYIHKMKHNLRV